MKIQYNRNRYYDYYTGRWLTHDPLGITPNSQGASVFNILDQYEDSFNLYEYAKSNPGTYTDWIGLGCNKGMDKNISFKKKIDIWFFSIDMDCKGKYGYGWTGRCSDTCRVLDPGPSLNSFDYDWGLGLLPPSVWVNAGATVGNSQYFGWFWASYSGYTDSWHNWGHKITVFGTGTGEDFLWVEECCDCASLYGEVSCTGTVKQNKFSKIAAEAIAALAVPLVLSGTASGSTIVYQIGKELIQKAAMLLL